MTTGTDGQRQTHPRSRPRASKRGALVYGFAGMMFALVAVMSFPSADTWYLILGTSLIAVAAVVFVARAIISLRTDEYATGE